MDTDTVIEELKSKYPGKVIIENKNEQGVTTEILCETDGTQDHPNYSTAIAVINSSPIHYHKVITETYKVLKGELTIFKYDNDKKDYKEYTIQEGEEISILPGEVHSNLGEETWVEVYSEPGWFIEDYYNLETIIKKYIKRED